MEARRELITRQDAPGFVCDLLQKRAGLGREDLSARSVARALGQTTGFLYHHWGSFDAFLIEVSGLGWQRLVDALVRAYDKRAEPRDVLHAYLEFAAESPVLYWLLAERPLAPDITRATLERGAALPSFKAWQAIFALISRAEPGITLAGARAVHAAVHGVASQLLSHRLGSMPDALTAGERAEPERAEPPPRVTDAAVHERFNLHASVHVPAHDDLARERLCRYLARPAFSLRASPCVATASSSTA